jgi:hypothetical protein
VSREVEDVFHIDQADIRLAKQAPGKTEAADLDGFEPGVFDDFGAQGIVAPRHHECLSALQRGTKNGSSISHMLASPLAADSTYSRFRMPLSSGAAFRQTGGRLQ